ncbi:hypothetical protein V2I01_23540 [Micromonospora sp. BRA006-A]|nr:hypothetical protein [Micromonospora sp. BRA006-A]
MVRLLVDDGTAYIVEAMRPDQPHLWPPMEALGVTNDPCNVQAGAGGVVAYLARAAGTPAASDLRPGLAVASRWLAARLRDDTRVLPGSTLAARVRPGRCTVRGRRWTTPISSLRLPATPSWPRSGGPIRT